MSEPSFEREKEPTSLPIEASEVSEYVRAIDEFDESQHDLNGAVSNFFSNPSRKKNRTALEIAIGNIVGKFEECVSQIHKTEDDNELRANSIAQLMTGEEETRLNAWEEFAPGVNSATSRYNQESVVSTITELYEQPHVNDIDMRLGISKFFTTGLQGDLHRAFVHINGHPSEARVNSDKRRALMRVVGESTLDIVKISIGVAGGIIAAKYLHRRS
jgi:hypothetical protein